MRERLLTLKEEQQENRRLCGRSYIKEYLEYVCVNEIGDLIKPHYVTESFPKLLKAKGIPKSPCVRTAAVLAVLSNLNIRRS